MTDRIVLPREMVRKNEFLCPADLRDLLYYNPVTGGLLWRLRPIRFFDETTRSALGNQAVWNARHAGHPALNCLAANGYLCGSILRTGYKAHRVAWAIYFGYWPSGYIDHENGVRTDNRISNLRDVTKEGNGRNQKLHSTNSSGISGVSLCRDSGKWRARIPRDGKMQFLGSFTTREEAAQARKRAERLLGYHENHGVAR